MFKSVSVIRVRLLRICLLFAMFVSIPAPSFASDNNVNTDNPGVYYLEDVADSYVSEDLPDGQHGVEPHLHVGPAPEFGYPRRIFLRFDHDPLPNDAVVHSAVLHLNMHTSTRDGAYDLDFHKVLAGWQETGDGGITWANQPLTTYHSTASIDDVTDGKTFDVTELVQKWVDGSAENHGLMIQAADEAGEWFSRGFYSREAGWCVPFLEVAYTTAGVPPDTPPRPPCEQFTDTVRTDLDIIVDPNPAFEGEPVQVTAVASDTVGIYQVRLVRSDLTVDHVVDETTPTPLEASDTVTLEPGNYRYTAWAQDAEHNWAFASVQLRVFHDGLAPRVWVEHEPADPENGDTITFTARAEDESLIRDLNITINGLEHRFRIDPSEETAEVTLDYDDTMGVSFLRYSASAWDLEDLNASTGTKYVLFGNDPSAGDADGDHLSDEIEEALGIDPEDNDTDGDGLYDHWEVLGYDADGDGSIDVDLPWMGATPYQKDVFWEIDWMESITETYAYQPESIQATINAYRDHGLHLHVDTGQYGGGEPLPYDDTRLVNGQNEGGAWYYDMKRDYFDFNRHGIFYYSAVTYGVDTSVNPPVVRRSLNGINGTSWRGGHTYLINRPDAQATDRARQTAILFHELGHGMELRHGGQRDGSQILDTLGPEGDIIRESVDWVSDNHNYMPNYLSNMNYEYQDHLKVQTGAGEDIFIQRFYTLPDSELDENNLIESDGYEADSVLGTYVWRRMGNRSDLLHEVREPQHVTYYVSWGGKDFFEQALADGSPIDWNRDGIITPTTAITFDLNPYPIEGIWKRDTEILRARNELSRLRPKIYGNIHSMAHSGETLRTAESLYQQEELLGDVAGEPRTDGEHCDGMDNDGDGLIDEGFLDTDNDGIADGIDNCMLTYNPNQFDTNRNWLGDVCEGSPDAPTNLILRGEGDHASLSWTPSANANVIGYNVYRRATDEGGLKRLGGDYPTALEAVNFRDDTCLEGAQYRVTAVDLYMKESAFSEIATLAEGVCQSVTPTIYPVYLPLISRR